jgi:putative addiction module killer protein
MAKNTIRKTKIFMDWFEDIKDGLAKKRIDARIKRARKGNFGDVKSVGDGVYEMRFKKLGFRLYYFERGRLLFWLLVGGDKSSQDDDIKLAKEVKLRIERGEPW